MDTTSSPWPLFDVAILGGGLAGLTLARQLRRELPALSVVVVDKLARPLPEACHKVGESSVEIGSNYFHEVLGLRKYLDERHLPKNGLRFYIGDTRGPLEARLEIAPSEHPVVPSFQLDRGRLENDLRAMDEADGVVMLEGYAVKDVTLATRESGAPHEVQIEGPTSGTLRARWVVDATGRRRLIQRKLGLGRDNGHRTNAAWFRVQGKVDVNDLASKDATGWRARDVDQTRWLSTVHLMGTGYWVWLIPLSSGLHSVGIVAEEVHHPFETIRTADRALAWIAEHEPALYAHLHERAGLAVPPAGAPATVPLEDFLVLKDYSYTSAQVFSRDRWTCVGEAGVFVDPLYSPGSDFIAFANCMTVELLRADFEGRFSDAHLEELHSTFLIFTESYTSIFRGGSHVQGRPEPFAAKVYWDDFDYWAYVCQYFFQRIYTLPPEEHAPFRRMAEAYRDLNYKAQAVVQAWARHARETPVTPFVPIPLYPSIVADLHIALDHERTPAQTYAEMELNLARSEEVVSELVVRALETVPFESAQQIAKELDVASWTFLRLGDGRLGPVSSERRKKLSILGREMERCLGRTQSDDVTPRIAALLPPSRGPAPGPPASNEFMR